MRNESPATFLHALQRVERGVTSAALRDLRSGHAGDRRALARRLLGCSPRTRALVALLRPDLTPAVAQAGGGTALRCALSWLRSGRRAAFSRLTAGDNALLDALHTHGDDLWHAWDAIERVGDGAPHEIVPQWRSVAAALTLLRAWRGDDFEELLRRAGDGDPAALRALALLPGTDTGSSQRALDALLDAQRRGTRPIAQAAREALGALARRHGLSATALAQRADLAAAWPDAGFDGKPARVWPVAPYTVRMRVRDGRAVVSVHSARGALRGVPQAVRRSPVFGEVRAAAQEVRTIARRFVVRFEAALVAQESFTGRALAVLRANPVVADVYDRLVWEVGAQCGVFEDDVLRDHDGDAIPWRDAPAMRVAHPATLASQGLLHPWQHRLLSRAVRQPFPQVFREVYQPDAGDELYCCRFAGRTVLARRAYALLRAREWSPGSGCARREWPAAGVRACLVWALERRAGRAARDQAGLVTTGPVWFERSPQPHVADASCAPVLIAEVPTFVLSEALRDFDLVIGHAGVGEAEFSARDTARFRGALLRDLARLHGLPGIAVGDGAHALIESPLGRLRLHLGTGTVHRHPGGEHVPLSMPAVQQALPVTADGPETAEILALALSLARGEPGAR